MSKIIGNTTATPVPRSDWEQTDKTKVDFIRNKPSLGTISEKDVSEFYTSVEIDEKIDLINESISGKANDTHNHNDVYYTESEIDAISSAINASITNIVNGTTTVGKAAYADNATSATTAGSATKATQDGNGKVISSTYETKADANNKLSEAKTYADEQVSDVASGFEQVIYAMYGEDMPEEEFLSIRDIANDEATSALESAKSYTDTKTSGLISASDVDTKISTHNTSASAHNDIRVLISDLSTKLNNFLDVDDATTDQLSEVITLINNNKGTLESLTSGKVNVSDIVDNLTTSSASKVLSAKQGVAIKALIDALESELDSHTHAIADVSGLQSALDGKAASSHGTHVSYSTTAPVMDGTASAGSASTVARSDHNHPTDTSRASKTELDTHVSDTTKHITSAERTNWNAAKTHADSTHAPSNAEKNQNAFSNIKVDSTTIAADTTTDTLTLVAGTNVTITPDATNDKITISATDTNTTYSAGTGISLSGTTFSNSGVRSISTGSSNGTISVNTNGTSANVAVKGLGSAAYTASTAYDAAGSANTALTSAKAYTDEVASGKADSSHNHAASNITSGTLSTSRLPTVPVAKGGTGHDFSDIPACSIIRNSSDNTGIWYTPTKNGAFYATGDNELPKFGTLPIAQGGTGATDAATARTNLGITPANIGAIPIGGGTVTGDLTLGENTNTSQHDLYIRRAIEEILKSARFTWMTDGYFRIQAASDGTVFNYMDLKTGSTVFKQPVSVSSGGTGHDFSDIPAGAIIRNSSDDTGLWYTQTKSGALYATGNDVNPKFGTLPIAQGGTGSTNGATGLKNLLAAGSTVLSSHQYGTSLPTAGTAGRIFFKKVSS